MGNFCSFLIQFWQNGPRLCTKNYVTLQKKKHRAFAGNVQICLNNSNSTNLSKVFEKKNYDDMSLRRQYPKDFVSSTRRIISFWDNILDLLEVFLHLFNYFAMCSLMSCENPFPLRHKSGKLSFSQFGELNWAAPRFKFSLTSLKMLTDILPFANKFHAWHSEK